MSVESGDFNGDGSPDVAASFLSSDCALNSCGVSVLLNRPSPSVSPAALDFGTVTQTANRPSLPLTISNSGGAPMKVNQILSAGNLEVRGTCSTIIPGGSCPVQVSLDASVLGELDGSVWVAVQNSDQILVPVKGNVIAPPPPSPPPPLTYKGTLKLTGPKKVKAGRKFKLKASASNVGTGALNGLTLGYKATQGRATKARGTLKLTTVAAGRKLTKSLSIAIRKRKLTRGKPLKVTVTLLRQKKILATKSLQMRLDFRPANSGKRR